jgi:hypothetical protein
MVARSEQNLHLLAEGWISVAGSIQKDEALLWRQFDAFSNRSQTIAVSTTSTRTAVKPGVRGWKQLILAE